MENSATKAPPFLIVDKKGLLGEALCEKLSNLFPLLLVSQKPISGIANIIHFPYGSRIPKIPRTLYAGILVVDDGSKITHDAIETFVKKAREDKVFFYLATHMRVKKSFVDEIIESYKKAVVVILGDVFMKNGVYDQSTLLSEFIIQARRFGKVEISPTGTEKIYPVFFDDVVRSLAGIITKKELSSHLLFLFPKHGATQLTVSRFLQKTNPLLRVDFRQKRSEEDVEVAVLPGGEYMLDEPYPLEQRIKSINLSSTGQNFGEKQKSVHNRRKFNTRKFIFTALIIILLFALPFLPTPLFALAGLQSLNTVKVNIENADTIAAYQSAQNAETFFIVSQKTQIPWSILGAVFGRDATSGMMQQIEIGRELSGAMISGLETARRLEALLAGKSKTPDQEIQTVTLQGENLIAFLQKLRTDNQIPKDVNKELVNVSPVINLAQSTLPVLPDLLGSIGKKTYLVLFQNNMELRPGGGFIGSYGLLTLDKGAIQDFSFYDVYDADGQLKGHIEPPYPLRRYIPQPHWYMRDSNFDVDFVQSASEAARFLYLEKGTVVDGVVAVDTSFIANILRATGPVYVPDYNKTATADNLFLLTEGEAEKNYFPGSTQKKDFLRSLSATLSERVFGKKQISALILLRSLSESLVQKHLLFAFPSQSLQQLFSVNGWSSTLSDTRVDSPTTVNDFLGINEANIGNNKANYFIRRKVSQNVTLADDGSINETVSIMYKNLTTAWPGGIYTNYLRFILPQDAVISKISIDGSEQKIVPAVTDYNIYEANGFTPPQGLEVNQMQESGKTVYGLLLTVPIGALKTIDISYTLAKHVTPDQQTVLYNLNYFKQPGTDGYPFTFVFSYPKNFRVVSHSSEIKQENGQLFFSGVIDSDIKLAGELGKSQ